MLEKEVNQIWVSTRDFLRVRDDMEGENMRRVRDQVEGVVCRLETFCGLKLLLFIVRSSQ